MYDTAFISLLNRCYILQNLGSCRIYPPDFTIPPATFSSPFMSIPSFSTDPKPTLFFHIKYFTSAPSLVTRGTPSASSPHTVLLKSHHHHYYLHVTSQTEFFDAPTLTHFPRNECSPSLLLLPQDPSISWELRGERGRRQR